MYILKNCKLIPALTEGTALERGDLVLDNGRIRDILPCGAEYPEAEGSMDVAGRTVMPGMIEGHVHLRWTTQSYLSARRPSALPLEVLRYAQFLLDLGYTTVRDVGDTIYYTALAVRDAVNAGKFQGPRIFTSGPTILPTAPFCKQAWENQLIANSPEEMRYRVRDVLQEGVDHIKLYGTNSMLAETGDPGSPLMFDDEMATAVRLAAMNDTYCAIHCHGDRGIRMALENGVRSIEHASLISEETLKRMDGRTDVAIVPTTVVMYHASLEQGESDTAMARRIHAMRDRSYDCLANAYTHNILIGWGTDIALPQYQQTPFMEFQIRRECLKYSNIDILKQATINMARIMKKDDCLGSIKVGKYADLLVLDGDPTENISVMYHKPRHVFKDGVLIR